MAGCSAAGGTYQIVTERIVALLQEGVVPWHQPWNPETGIPRNLLSKREYRGLNVILLGIQAYASPYWLTIKQANQLGGRIRKGEKSTPVVFWKQLTVNDEDRHGLDIEAGLSSSAASSPLHRLLQPLGAGHP